MPHLRYPEELVESKGILQFRFQILLDGVILLGSEKMHLIQIILSGGDYLSLDGCSKLTQGCHAYGICQGN